MALEITSMPRNRHARLETLLRRFLKDAGAPGRFPVHYEACVVCGVHPSQGMGPMPYFAYLVLTHEGVLAVRWPSKIATSLVTFDMITDLRAVASEAPNFLFEPHKTTAQQVRIHYLNGQLEKESTAIDVFVLHSCSDYLFFFILRRKWILTLMNSASRDSNGALQNCKISCLSLFDGTSRYQWLLRSVARSSSSAALFQLAIDRAVSWSRQDSIFRAMLWQDSKVLKQLLGRRYVDDELVKIVNALSALLYDADSDITWMVLKPHLESISIITIETVNIPGGFDGCIALWHSILSLPYKGGLMSPANATSEIVCSSPTWVTIVTLWLDRCFSILKADSVFLATEVGQLFKIFQLVASFLENNTEENLLNFINFHYSEEFRYYLSTERINAKMPTESNAIKDLVISSMLKLKRLSLKSESSHYLST